MHRRLFLGTLGFLAALGLVAWASQPDDLAKELPHIPPTAATEALKTLQLAPGFRLEQVAAEPLVTDPVCAAYDADGRLYVVEMRGYPFPEQTPSGGVSRLEDTDGDGRFDRRAMFLEGLSWPTGVVPFDGGVFIAVAPDILFAKDTNGDGVADVKTVIFTGFGTQNVQQLVNGLCWGLDGWIYGASAGNGGDIKNPSRPDAKPVSVRGRDFRFKADGSAFEAISGGGQFGLVFDDFGHRFACNNRWHARQIVLPSKYLARAPALAVQSVIADIASDGNEAPVYRVSPPEPWRVVRSKQYEAKMKIDAAFARKLPNAERHPSGFFSSASGLTIYRGSAFPAAYRGNVFVCDVAGNLVHRKVLTKNGAIFRADRAEPGRKEEFLASTDLWFRPVNLANTPDGTLLVLDMYRETIEHPLSIPDDIKQHLDLTSGKDRGRLYEVVPESFRQDQRRKPELTTASTAALVAHLADGDAWWRETSQRLLIERRDPAAVTLLHALVHDRPSALARVHGLWTLEVLGKLTEAEVLAAFADPEPGVREQAAILAEERAPERGFDPKIHQLLILAAADPDPMVRFQVALSLGSVGGTGTAGRLTGLRSIARTDVADAWTRMAVLCSVGDDAARLFSALTQEHSIEASPEGKRWLEDLAALIAARNREGENADLLRWISDGKANPGQVGSALLGLKRGQERLGTRNAVIPLAAFTSRLGPMLERAAGLAAREGPEPERVDAIRLLALAPPRQAMAVLPDLLDAHHPPEVQLAALRVLAESPEPKVGEAVAEHWRSLSPSLRREAAEVLLARSDRTSALLDAIAAQTVAVSDLDPARRQQLLAHPSPSIRDRAGGLIGREAKSDRSAVVKAFRAALDLAGDRARGRAVFVKTCATCHKAEGTGVEVGPNLVTVAAKPAEDLLVHVLDPNREVAPGFVNYNVATTDGRIVSGLIAEETGASLTLRRAEGVTEIVPRARIEAVTATGLSLMPEGLEKGLTAPDLADLIAFIRGLPAVALGPTSAP